MICQSAISIIVNKCGLDRERIAHSLVSVCNIMLLFRQHIGQHVTQLAEMIRTDRHPAVTVVL